MGMREQFCGIPMARNFFLMRLDNRLVFQLEK